MKPMIEPQDWAEVYEPEEGRDVDGPIMDTYMSIGEWFREYHGTVYARVEDGWMSLSDVIEMLNTVYSHLED